MTKCGPVGSELIHQRGGSSCGKIQLLNEGIKFKGADASIGACPRDPLLRMLAWARGRGLAPRSSRKGCPTVFSPLRAGPARDRAVVDPIGQVRDGPRPMRAWRRIYRDRDAALAGNYRPCRSLASRSRGPRAAHKHDGPPVRQQNGPDQIAFAA